jgi:hypothetical protein
MTRARALVGVCVAILLAGRASPARADTSYFGAQTTAAAVHVTLTQEPASSIITASLVDDAMGYAASDFTSGSVSEAVAATAFPGNLVVQGPQLLCSELFPCPAQPPAYPFLADASYPRSKHATANANGQQLGTGPVIVTPLTATATATATANNGSTAGGKSAFLAGTPVGVTVGSSTSVTSVRTTGSTETVQVSSVVNDISIGALLHISSVRASDSIMLNAGHKPVDRPVVVVSGATVAGQSASIDDNGVHVAGHDGPSLSRAVRAHGIDVHTVPSTRHDTRVSGRSQTGGLAIDISYPVSGVPYVPNPLPTLPPPFDQIPHDGVNANGTYVAHITFGTVGAVAALSRQPVFDLGAPPLANPSTPPGSTAHGSAPGTVAGPLPGGSSRTATTPAAPSGPPAVAGAPGGVRGFLDALGRDALEDLYLVLALGTAVLFIGWRTAVVVRFRRRREAAWARPPSRSL